MLLPLFTNKPFWVQFCFLLLFILGGITIFSSLSLLLVTQNGLETGSRAYMYVVQSVSTFGTFFLPALFFSYCSTKGWFSYSKANKKICLQLVGYVLVLSIFMIPVIVFLGYFNEQISMPSCMQKIEIWMREMEEIAKIALKVLTDHSTISILLVNIIVMALLPALFEEFLFRGTLQPFFTRWFANKHLAILCTAFIFSAIHFQFYGFIPRFILGIYLGYLLLWGKSLWLPILAHFSHNTLSLIMDFLAQRNGIDSDALEPSQIAGFYPIVLLCTVCVAGGIYFLQKYEQRF